MLKPSIFQSGATMNKKSSRLSLSAYLVLALAIPAVLMLLVAIAADVALERNSRAAYEMLRVSEARFQYQRLLTAVLDAETGKHGYVITGDITFLAPYREAPETFADALARIASLEAEQHEQGLAGGVERVEEVRGLFRRWREQVAAPAIDARRQHPVALESLATRALGRFERLRNLQEDAARPEVIVEVADLLSRGRALAEDGPTRDEWQAAQVSSASCSSDWSSARSC